jgi:hypothetical protein
MFNGRGEYLFLNLVKLGVITDEILLDFIDSRTYFYDSNGYSILNVVSPEPKEIEGFIWAGHLHIGFLQKLEDTGMLSERVKNRIREVRTALVDINREKLSRLVGLDQNSIPTSHNSEISDASPVTADVMGYEPPYKSL